MVSNVLNSAINRQLDRLLADNKIAKRTPLPKRQMRRSGPKPGGLTQHDCASRSARDLGSILGEPS